MSIRVSHRRTAACTRLLAPVVASALLLGSIDTAHADTPEYWNRETFRTERPIIASLSSTDDETTKPAARRVTPRQSITRSHAERPAKARRTEARKRQKHVRVASLGKGFAHAAEPARNIAGGGAIRWVASSRCLNSHLRGVLAQVAARFGSVTVNSTCRSRSRNARVGGARRSMHLTGNAADFRVAGNRGAASSFIRSLVGGFKHYGGGLFHIDTGPRRTW